MNKLREFWIRIFYFTFQIFIGAGEYIIQRPLRFLFKRINTNPMRKLEIDRATKKVLNDKEFGFRVRFASISMTFTMFFILSSFVLIFTYLSGLDIRSKRLDYFLYVIIGISYLIHYIAVLKNDFYLTFFNQLDSLEVKRTGIIGAILFHSLVMLVFVLLMILVL